MAQTVLNFTKISDQDWVANTEINDSTAIHVERPESGLFYIKQSHVKDGEYMGIMSDKYIMDPCVDISIMDIAKVYPLYLEIHSEIEPTNGCLVF